MIYIKFALHIHNLIIFYTMRNFILATFCLLFLNACVDYTETVPPPTTTEHPEIILEKIGFGSCNHQLFKPFKAFQSLASQNPDLFLFGGDNIYGDLFAIAPGSEKFMDDSYQKLFGVKDFKDFYDNVPFITTWDDHDYGQNDGDRTNAAKQYAKKLFFKYWNVATPRRQNPDGAIYGSYYYGTGDKRVQVIALDLRWNMSPRSGDQISGWEIQNDPSKTLLGDQQWAWLEQELQKPAKVRIVLSSLQFAASYNKYEAWNIFPHERKKMLDLIKSTGAEGLLFVSGDVHFADLSVVNEPGLYPIYDITASGMNIENATPYDNDARIVSYQGLHYGMINIDWSSSPTLINLEIHDVNGNKAIERSVSLDELKF
jgi:alkaline phosphatase D